MALQQLGVGGVADGIEQAPDGQIFRGACGPVPQADGTEPVLAHGCQHLPVPVHCDGGIGQDPVRHGGTGAQSVAAHDQVHLAAVFGQIDGLLTGRITATDHGQLLLAELGRGPVADGTGTDAPAPEAFLIGDAEPVGTGPRRQDQGVGPDGFAFRGDQPVGPHGKVQRLRIGFQQLGPPAQGLGLAAVHQLRSQDAVGEAGIVLDVGGGHQLAPGDATPLETGDQQGGQVGPGGIDGSCVAGGT